MKVQHFSAPPRFIPCACPALLPTVNLQHSIMSSPPAEIESRQRQGDDNMLVDADEYDANDPPSADSSDEPEDDEEEARRIRDGFIVDEDEEEEEVPDDEEEKRRKRKRRKKHHRRGRCNWLLIKVEV